MKQKRKTGVLLVNLGTPDGPDRSSVYRYLKQFLMDGRVIDIPALPRNILVKGIIAPFRSGSSAKLYKELWTDEGSPLLYYGEKLEREVQAKLGDDYIVKLAMRYQSPSIESGLEALYKANIDEILVLPLFPHYASATVGSVMDEVMRLMRKEQTMFPVRFIHSFYDDPKMIQVFVENAKAFDLDSYDHILFSYHGIPQRHLRKGDREKTHCLKDKDCCQNITLSNQFCYSAQCYATTKAIVKELGLKEGQYTTSFQSRLGRDPWTQPYTIKEIEAIAERGGKRILVFSPAFVSDCLETIIEIGLEYNEEFEEMGGEHIDLVPSLNDHPLWIESVVDMLRAD